MENQQQNQLNVDLKNTTSITTPSGDLLFSQGVILRKVSKFIIGAEEDAILPLVVFYDQKTGKILKETLPIELREEYQDFIL
jgi:hypothetical protein